MAYAWNSVLFLVVLGFFSAYVLGSAEEDKLVKELLTDYERLTPPTPARNDSVIVQFGITLQKLLRVNEAENSISLMVWLNMRFQDYRLEWDPAKYNDIRMVRLPFQRIWLPDIVLYNGLSGSRFFEDKIMATVTNTGWISAIPPMLVTASCDMDLTFFPFDIQVCKLKYGSWTYSSSSLDFSLISHKVEVADASGNPEWKLTNATMERHATKYPCCPTESYPDITATLELERRSGPYSVKLVIPSVLTAFLILFTFILPSSSGEKIVFCLVLLLSLLLLLVYLHISVPSNSESVLGEFLTFALFLDFFATIIAVICYFIADSLLMRDKLGGPESEKHWRTRKRKLKGLRITEFVFFFVFLLIFIIGSAVILTRRG